MSTPSDFEIRRRERRRRQRLRKKRIRAVLILALFIGLIVLICAAVSAVLGSKTDKDNLVSDQNIITSVTPAPTEVPVSQTASASIPAPEEENNLLQIIADSGQTKRCYLTFDDGPTDNITPQVLDVLRRYNVKATFFQVGSLIEANPDMARRVYEEGHLLANHSNGHNYDKLYATSDSFITEILACEDQIRSVMNGEDPFKLIRFPGGSYNAGDHASEKQLYKKLLAQNGYYYCDWNALTGDAEGRTKNASELLAYLKENMEGYNNLIVLMHDASTKQATADALPSVIEYIASQGYTFHRLDDIVYQAQTDTTTAVSNDTSDGSGISGSSSSNSSSSSTSNSSMSGSGSSGVSSQTSIQ